MGTLHSMTGFASGSRAIGGYLVSIQMKAVNNRYLDIFLKFPAASVELEQAVRDTVKAALQRGRVDVWVELQPAAGGAPPLNTDLVRQFHAQLAPLADELKLTLQMRDLLTLPGVLKASAESATADAAFQAGLLELLREVLAAFAAMRAREGANLREVMAGILDAVTVRIEAIAAHQETVRQHCLARWQKRLGELLTGAGEPDPARLLQEAAYQAERADIAEELDRFRSHLQQFRDVLAAGGPAGKKLDFILQELNREANTILSKTDLIEISRLGIDLKADIEKLREQIQNIE
ncbi:MAG TPA: YicC family protein [Acidobacteriota bacterium]|nr:YicC family protein [Acidobacteriota bacterium]HQF88012.1 YicC family protein [Acidobacteriota bacterium]HQG92178.1 YicC family protein [Acidobacteriota bacterium]